MTAPLDRPLRVAPPSSDARSTSLRLAELAGRLARRRMRTSSPRPTPQMYACSTPARSPRRRMRHRQRIRRLRRLESRRTPRAHRLAVSMRTPARTPPSTRSSPIPTRAQSPTTCSPWRAAWARHATRRRCARARSSRCRTAATIAARTASSGRRGASRRAFPPADVHERVRAAIEAVWGDRAVRRRPRVVRTATSDNLATLVGSLLNACGTAARLRLSSVNANDVPTR